jgi:hypothetical protein
MKTAMIIVCIVASLVLAGILYGTQGLNEAEHGWGLAEAYTHQYPVEMPSVVMHPVSPLF